MTSEEITKRASRITKIRYAFMTKEDIDEVMAKQAREWEASRQNDPEDLIPRG